MPTADTDDPREARERYERWAGDMHRGAHARRSAQRNAAFFLPHLSSGMRLLDVGCGPGSITVGLADAVAPGEVVGVDANPAAIAAARERSDGRVRFDVADALALPFDDGGCDAVFMHEVLQHVESPAQALREAHRVLRPGGVIGLADADYDGTIIEPDDPLLHRSFEIQASLRALRGGDVRIGKRLRELLHDAGFGRTVASAVAATDGTAEAARRTGEREAQYYAATEFADYAVAAGVTTREELRAVSGAWRAWSQHPGAFWARFWCQAVGWRERSPESYPLGSSSASLS
jgi:ubiquinone/menaquinone biosynthesis C-methylase UbiE